MVIFSESTEQECAKRDTPQSRTEKLRDNLQTAKKWHKQHCAAISATAELLYFTVLIKIIIYLL